MRLIAALVLSGSLSAQTRPVLGIARGDLTEIDASQPSGEFTIRTASENTLRFSFDSRTYFERDRERIPAARLQKGDAVEVVSEPMVDSPVRYARIVQVVNHLPAPARPAAAANRYKWRYTVEHIVPRGNLTFTGLIARVAVDRLVLRLRAGGEQTIMLRPDTRYMDSGSASDRTALQLSTRVFVRGGKNLDGEIEAYQVIWGEILAPGGAR